MIKRSITSAVLLTGLLCSAAAFAEAAPTCDSDTFNMVIVNKDLPSGDCSSPNGDGNYCLYYPDFIRHPLSVSSCSDQKVILFDHETTSVSAHKIPNTGEITYSLGTKGSTQTKTLWFKYAKNSPMPTSNCAEVFGSDVKCVLSKSSIGKHMTYKLVISKVQ